MSWQGSPPRKRKSPFDDFGSPTSSYSGRTDKRQRSILRLNKELRREQLSPFSHDSSKFEDEDTRSFTSVSVASVPSENVVTNDTERDYTSLAARYNVKSSVVRKYYSCLSNQPRVAIIRTPPIKPALISPSKLEESISLSPVFSGKRRTKKKQRSGEPDASLPSSSKYNNVFDESVNSNSVQHENVVDAVPLRLGEVNKRTRCKVEKYLQSLSNGCRFKEEISPESSPTKDLPRASNDKAYDSADEFQCSRNKSSKTSEKKRDEKRQIVSNPFSKKEQERKNSSHQKKDSFWKKKFGNLDRATKNKKFLETFIKKAIDNNTDTAEEPNTIIKSQELTRKRIIITKRKRVKYYGDTDDDTEIDDGTESKGDKDAESFDSLSVNCQFLPTRNTDSKGEDHTKNSDNELISPLMSFGVVCQDEEEEEEEEVIDEEGSHDEDEVLDEESCHDEHEVVAEEQVQDISLQDDIIDLCIESPQHTELINEESVAATNNLFNGFDEKSNDNHDIHEFDEKSNGDSGINGSDEKSNDDLGIICFGEKSKDDLDIKVPDEKSNDNLGNNVSDEKSTSSLSDDMFRSPSNSPDRLVINLTPSSTVKQSEYTEPSPLSSARAKGKPKIKSDTKLENHKYIISRKKPRNVSVTTSPSSSATESNDAQTPSKKGNSNEVDSNGIDENIKIDSTTPTTRGIKAALQQVKCNLNDVDSVKEYQNARSKNADVETFEDICQDLTNLTNTESITLYRGTEDAGGPSDNVVVLNQSSNECAQERGDSTPSSVPENNESEAQAPTSKILTRRSSRIDSTAKTPTKVSLPKLGESSDTPSQQKTPTRPARSPTLSPFPGFPRIPRRDQRLNQSSASPATLSRDPRLNRSLSPTKPLSVPAENARVTRSNSLQKSPGVLPADPRLTRGQSRPRSSTPTPTPPPPTNCSPTIEEGKEVEVVDPRLRRRKQREEAERAAAAAELAKSNATESEQPLGVSQFGSSALSSPPRERKQRAVFQRLGIKEPSPTRKAPPKNEFVNFIKPNESPKKTPAYETEVDDDEISLHPSMDLLDVFEEDEENTSPRHQKFISERSRTAGLASLAASTSSSSSSATTTMHSAPQQRIPVRERIGSRVGGGDASGNRRAPAPITAPSDSSAAAAARAPPIRTTTTAVIDQNARLANRQTRFGSLGAQRQVPPQQRVQNIYTSVPPPNVVNVNVPPPLITPSNSQFASSSSFVDKFYQHNNMQMMQDQDNMEVEEDKKYYTFDNGVDNPNEYDHVSILDNKPDITTHRGLSDPRHTFFRQQCYRLLRQGKCENELHTCSFKHQAVDLLKKVKTQDPPFVKAILDTCIKYNFDCFLERAWKDALPLLKGHEFTMFEKLYQAGKRSQNFVVELLNHCLSTKAHDASNFIREINKIIENNDSDTVQAICVAIKSHLQDGFYWEAIRPICEKAAPPKDMVEIILMQCVNRKKSDEHIKGVYKLVKQKLLASVRDSISKTKLKTFYELVERRNLGATDKETLNVMPLMNVTNNLTNGQRFERQPVTAPKTTAQPPVQQKPGPKPKSSTSAASKAQSFTPKSPDSAPDTSPGDNQGGGPVEGETKNFEEFKPSITIDAPADPQSVHRDRFWKLYAAVGNIDKGLQHNDYDYVWEQLDKFAQEEQTDEMVRRAFYQILCKEVKLCEHHLTEILQRAVIRSSEKSARALFVVGVHALIDLGNSDLWVMAEMLLKKLIPFQPEKLPTAYILISAEIYLANSDPVEALCLLQRTKLIRTNRDEWRVNDSKKSDEKHRNKVVFILLQALTYLDPEKAVFLFKELLADQYIYYFPVDLSSYLDKFTLLLLLHKKLDLAAEIARLAMDNDMRFQKPTFQELLTFLLPVDEVLVNQILDYAVNLGYYNDMQIRDGFTTLILDMNYTDAEIYLLLKRLVHKLTINFGPTIARLKPNTLKVTLVFEDIPNCKRLHRNETATTINLNKNRQMKSRVGHILSERFHPAIKLSQGKPNRFCKIMSSTLVDHLKNWHSN